MEHGKSPIVPKDSPRVVYHNFPESFNPRTMVEYDLKSPVTLDIAVYDLPGRRVETLFHGRHPSGEGFEIGWEPKGVSSGVYLMRFTAPGYVKSERLVLMK